MSSSIPSPPSPSMLFKSCHFYSFNISNIFSPPATAETLVHPRNAFCPDGYNSPWTGVVSLLMNPNPTPSRSPHYSPSDFSKMIVSTHLITSLLCLKLFVTCCPDASPTGPALGSPPISSHLHPSPNTTFMSNKSRACPNDSPSIWNILFHLLLGSSQIIFQTSE